MRLLLSLLIIGSGFTGSGDTGFCCMFWNVENLFEGRTHFRDKCNGIAKTIMLAGDEFGGLPDVVGLAEVENATVLRRLIGGTCLRKSDYAIVHYDSPDRRGIDCALLYRRSRFRLQFSKPCHITDSSGRILPTRDILLVVLTQLAFPEGVPPEGRNTRGCTPENSRFPGTPCSIAGGPSRRDGGVSPEGELPKGVYLPETAFGGEMPGPLPLADGRSGAIAILVNHHPSKVGAGSETRRKIAMARLTQLRDSLLAEGISRIIAIGDFNDTVTSAPGVEEAYKKGAGTIKFQGRWEKIDGCPVLEGFSAREHIFAPPCLSEPDRRFTGIKPHRSWSGPRWNGGLSDHYPIILECLPCN